MVDDQDWTAIMQSEIFRNYVALELNKEAELEANREVLAAEKLEADLEEQNVIYGQLEAFEQQIKKNPGMLEYFRKVKKALATVPGLAEKTDKKFLSGLELLDLGE